MIRILAKCCVWEAADAGRVEVGAKVLTHLCATAWAARDEEGLPHYVGAAGRIGECTSGVSGMDHLHAVVRVDRKHGAYACGPKRFMEARDRSEAQDRPVQPTRAYHRFT